MDTACACIADHAMSISRGKVVKQIKELCNGDIATVKLTKHALKSDDVHPIDSRHILYFDNHSNSCASGNDASDTLRLVGKRSLNSSTPDMSLNKYSSYWELAKKADDKVKSVTCKE